MKKLVLIFAVFGVMASVAPQLKAQCPMCKASVEANHNTKTSPLAKGLNTGILLLFFLPYTSLMILGVVLFSFYKKRKRAEIDPSINTQDRESEGESLGLNAQE